MPNHLRKASQTPETGTLDEWKRGMAFLRSLGNQFVAIYGAEPLQRWLFLPEIIREIYSLGMKATVITAFPGWSRMKDLLCLTPLDSVTSSYDHYALDYDRARKNRQSFSAIANLDAQDRALVATVTNGNVQLIDRAAKEVTAIPGGWFLFDIMHQGHGPLSKCGNEKADRPPAPQEIKQMCERLLALKVKGLRIHASVEFLEFLRDNYTDPRSTWHCVRGDDEPAMGWLTVDANGQILACDDYQKAFPGGAIWTPCLDAKVIEEWVLSTRQNCIGCCWNTHFDACRIEKGAAVGSYIHTALPSNTSS